MTVFPGTDQVFIFTLSIIAELVRAGATSAASAASAGASAAFANATSASAGIC